MALPVSAEQITRLPLATTKGHSTGWLDWFAEAGIDDTSSLDFIEFETGGLALDNVTTGNGVALVTETMLIQHELATGTLVRINPLRIASKSGLPLFCPETQFADVRILAFADWLKSVMARIQAG